MPSAAPMPGNDFRITVYDDVAALEFLAERYASDRREDVERAMQAVSARAEANLLVLDFGEVMVLSSLALQPIQVVLREFKRAGGKVVATGGGDLVRKLLGFFPDLPQAPSKGDAIAALSETARQVYAREEGA